MIEIINDSLSKNLSRNQNLIHIVLFGSKNCGPCVSIRSIITQIEDDLSKNLYGHAFYVGLENNFQTAAQYKIMTVPTVIIFRGTTPIRSFVGARTKDQMIRIIEEI